jgi:tyrosinase
MHLAVRGSDVPSDSDYDVCRFVNGDMGDNDTAAFYPILSFRHCFYRLRVLEVAELAQLY